MDYDLRQFQSDHKAWATANFGEHPSWHSLLGIIEEVGELEEAKRWGQLEGVEDAIGDTMIYITDFATLMNFDLREIWNGRRDSRGQMPIYIWTGKLAHSFLKMSQGIRGSEKLHRQDIEIILNYIVGELGIQASRYGKDAIILMYETWETVKQRDWKANPVSGSDASKSLEETHKGRDGIAVRMDPIDGKGAP